jgi:6-phosphogluconolactonase
VTAFIIDQTTGTLTEIAGSPFGAGTHPDSIAIDPTDTYAYVANEESASISEYALNITTGALTPVSGSPLSTVSSPESLAINPQGSFLYAANVTAANSIASYGITPSTGALSLATTAGAGAFPASIAVDNLGGFVYVANENTGNVSVYTANTATGALTPVAGSPFLSGAGARAIAID